MTDQIKEAMNDNKVVRWFLRFLSGLILVNTTAHILYHTWQDGDIPMGVNRWTLTIGCLSIWAAWEGVRLYLNRKMGN